jgi:hypothetical protein
MPLFDPGVWNLTLYAGATFSQRATPGAASVNNLTGYNARAMIRPTYPTTTPTLTLGTAAGTAVITLGGTAGWVQVDIDAATTAALGSAAGYIPTDYVWDLELVNGADVTRFCYGIVSLSPESTR